ncbi:MAG TPA: transketolase [Candidatus Dormibacteraeota bacterium]|nr:transketolase [Candidatus Dormibacteraeota bacterium]
MPVSGRGIRRLVLEQSKRANVGHIGSALSVADILATLYGGVLQGGAGDPDRDRFVMSKGHAAIALYAALHLAGFLTRDDLESYIGEGSLLGVHPHHGLPGVDFSTGSLGQGLAFATGAALAARLAGSQRRSYALLSDAEVNEGSVWESVMFAAHHRLDNLVAIVDLNGQQALGYTADVISLAPLEDRWRAFNWDVHVVPGHDRAAMASVMAELPPGRPHVLIAQTTFGKGVSFMEGQIRWHYMPMNDEEYAIALGEIGG